MLFLCLWLVLLIWESSRIWIEGALSNITIHTHFSPLLLSLLWLLLLLLRLWWLLDLRIESIHWYLRLKLWLLLLLLLLLLSEQLNFVFQASHDGIYGFTMHLGCALTQLLLLFHRFYLRSQEFDTLQQASLTIIVIVVVTGTGGG